VTTTKLCPWAKPAEGARKALSRTLLTSLGSTASEVYLRTIRRLRIASLSSTEPPIERSIGDESCDKPLLASPAVSKKLEQKQQRRLAEERRQQEAKREQRKRNLVTVLIALVVIALVAALVISDRQRASGPVGVAASEAGCGEVEEVEAAGNEHIEPGTPHEEYNSNPPTNGPHWPVSEVAPVPGGFYDEAQVPEAVIHNLEHGQIVFWYDPNAPQQVKDDLEDIVSDETGELVATPYEGLEDYNFYMTAWTKGPNEPEDSFGTGHLMGCDLVSEAVIDDFRRDFQGKSPEPITPPFTG
jgi:hypothetical protein